MVGTVGFQAALQTKVWGWPQWIGLVIAAGIWLTVTWYTGKYHMHPWRLLKQVGAIATSKARQAETA